ncbi:helix-turn-helix transcriptional regulator [Sphingobacterium sp.]|uniref:helix-turn-helix domain-containing protein n=1 Tax=Sphingobacterium TaxID=28453 RepID=UPI0025831D43|nr:helix-turn-helix transcriptional regulator [Sphingobacterium sp.]WET68778.1 MAG: helix-turn-helix transcriptional regulator [Sphingobacterium sp.]
MAQVIEIVEKEMSHLDYLLIIHIKSLREKNGWTQQELSKRMGVAVSFVGNVENLTERHKYSIRHLGLLKKAFNYTNISQLFDFKGPTHDQVILTIEITRSNNEDGKKNRIIKSELKSIKLENQLI